MSLKYLVILFPWGSYVKILNLPQLKRELRTQIWGLEHKQTVAEPVYKGRQTYSQYLLLIVQ